MPFEAKALLLATVACVALGSTAHAQSTSNVAGAQSGNQPQADQATGEIIVTAQKRAQRLIDVPQSVSVISADLLQQTHAERLQDFFTRVPSASIVEGQAGLARIVLRGINTGGVGATVATYVDETPYGSATSLANGAVLTPDLDPSDIDRVEVLRGPQGTLYGANSLGGLVKYVTTLPSTTTLGGSAEGSFEGLTHGSFGYSGRASINIPVADKVGIRASGFYRHDPGFIDDPRFGKNINDGETYGGRVSLLLKPTERLTLRGTAMLENLDSNGTNAQDVDPVTLRPIYGDRVQKHIIRQPNYTQYRVYNGTVDYDFGPVKLISSTSWGNLDETAKVDDSPIFTPALAGLFGTIGYSQDQRVHQRRFTQEVRLSASAPAMFDWTLGAFYTRERNEIRQGVAGVDYATGTPLTGLVLGAFPIDNLAAISAPSRYRELAGFANGTIHFTPKFDLTFGGRYSGNDQVGSQINDGILVGGPSTVSTSSHEGVWTYSVAPAFKPTRDLTIYARVAKGYRPGGPNVISPQAPAAVPRQFGSDTTTNYEGGIKAELLDRKLSIELTGFYIDWNSIQLLTVVSNFGVNINGGSARSQGGEVSLAFRPLPGLSLSANGAYVDAHLTQDTPALVGGRRGDQLPYVARFSSTLAADYERPLNDRFNGTAGVSWRYTGSRFASFSAAPPEHQRLSPFGQLDAHVGVTFDKFRIDAFARNLTDSKGIVDLGGAGSALNGGVAAAIVRPRSFGATLGFRY